MHRTLPLGKPVQEIYEPGGDFMFHRKAAGSCRFSLPNLRPGTYTLCAYATHGPATAHWVENGAEVRGAPLRMGLPWCAHRQPWDHV